MGYLSNRGIPEDSIQSIELKEKAHSQSYDKGVVTSNFDYEGNFNRLLRPTKEVLEKKLYENRDYGTYFTFVAKIKGFPDYISIIGHATRALSKETQEKEYQLTDQTLRIPDNFYDSIALNELGVTLKAKDGALTHVYVDDNYETPLTSIVDLVPLLATPQPKEGAPYRMVIRLDNKGKQVFGGLQDLWRRFQ